MPTLIPYQSLGPGGISPPSATFFQIFSDFTGFWAITKRLADSQRIANLQMEPACRFEKLPTSKPYQRAFKSIGTYYQKCSNPICRLKTNYEHETTWLQAR